MDLESGLVLFLMVDVSEHDRWSSETDLTVCAERDLFLGSRLADHVVGVRIGESDGAFLLLVIRSKAACCDTFCCSVALTDPDGCAMVGKELVKLLLELD